MHVRRLTLLFIIIIIPQDNCIEDIENRELIHNCLSKIISTDSSNYFVVIYSSLKSNDFVNELTKISVKPRVLINLDFQSQLMIRNNRKYDLHILFLNSLSPLLEMEKIMESLHKTSIWNSRGKFLVIARNDTEIDEIFKIVWAYNIFNVNLLMVKFKTVQMYTFFPYKDSECSKITIELIGNYTIADNLPEKIFPIKIPNNLHQCPVRIIANVYPPLVLTAYGLGERKIGAEASLINTIIKTLNMSKFQTGMKLGFSNKLSNGSYSGILQGIFENKSDIAYGQVFPNISYFSDFDATIFYQYIDITWVVPKALPVKQWQRVIFVFNKMLWILIFVSLLLYSIIWWFFGRKDFLCDRKVHQEFSWCFINCLYVLLQGGIRSPIHFDLRMIFIVWVLATLSIACIYQSQLVSVLTQPVYEKQITNIDELVESDLKIQLIPDFWSRFNNSLRPIDKLIIKKARMVSIAEHNKLFQTHQNTFAFMMNRNSFNYLLPTNFSYSPGNPAMYQFRSTMFGNPICMMVKQDFPLLDKMNRIISRCMESGLFLKWMRDVVLFIGHTEDADTNEALTLSHLLGAFFILLFGLLASIHIFIAEIVYLKLKIMCTNNK